MLLLVAHQLGRAYTAQQCEWMEIPMKTSVKNLFWYDEKNSLNSHSAQKNDKVIELWGDFVIFNWSFSDQTSFKGKKNFVKLSYDKCKLFFYKNHPITIWWQMRLEGHRAKLIFHFYFPSKFFLWDVYLDQIWAIFWPWILWFEFSHSLSYSRYYSKLRSTYYS